MLITNVKAHDDSCVVILSSNFVQRGSPAVISKFSRAKIALSAGADLVIELPFLFACSAGQDFARGAVNLLSHFADTIAFGMENPELDAKSIIKAENSPSFVHTLKHELSRGASYSKAHALALEAIIPGAGALITKPNNMLAVSYIRENKYGLKTFPVKRKGDFSSKAVRAGQRDLMPAYSRAILEYDELSGRMSEETKLWPLLQGIFIRSRVEDLTRIWGIDEGIEGLFLKHWRESENLDDFVGKCVCARYTRSHIKRRLIYILLGLDRWEVFGAVRGGVPYARVLGFNEKGREILRKASGIKIITRLADAKGGIAGYFADVEFRASQLYELTLRNPDFKHETQKPVIIQPVFHQ